MSQHEQEHQPWHSMPVLDADQKAGLAELWNRKAKDSFQMAAEDSQVVLCTAGRWQLHRSESINIEGYRFDSPFIEIIVPCHATKSGVVEKFNLTQHGTDFITHWIANVGLTPTQCKEAAIDHKSLKLDVKVSGDIGTDPEPKKGTPVHMVILVGQTKENWQRHRVAYITTHKKVAATVQKQLRTLGHMTKLAETELDLPDNMTLDNKTDLTPAQLAESLKIKVNDK